ncbi:MAG: hypothetical protein ACFE8Z_11595 [Candidatus Hermodarchaeota archaeon]
MAEHENVSKKRAEDTDQKRRFKQQESQPLFDQFHTWELSTFPVAETPYLPRMDQHASLLARATSNEGIAKLMLQLQQTYGNQYVQRLIESVGAQAKLTVSDPNDIYEQEADRVADAVTKVTNPSLQSQAEQEEEEEELRMEHIGSQLVSVSDTSGMHINAAQASGQPFSDSVREPMVRAFGHDFSYLRWDKANSHLASAAPPPTHVVSEEEEEVGSETVEGTLPSLDTEAALLLAGEMKESEDLDSTLESDVLPTAFIDGGSIGEDRIWWAGGTLGSNVLPTAFVNSGSTGSDTVWWAGGGATGARGNQGVGSFQEKVDPIYDNEPASEGGKYMAWIRDNTGKVKVERSYVSVKTGANGNDWYITARAKTRIETHEKGHVNKSKELYESYVKPIEDKVPDVRGKSNAVEAGNSAAQAVKSLKDAVKWDDGINNFKQKDKDANKPGGTWDTQEQATADWYYDYGPRGVGNKNYTHYVDQTPGPSSGS